MIFQCWPYLSQPNVPPTITNRHLLSMVPNVASPTPMNPIETLQPLIRSTTLPTPVRATAPDRTLLAPEDAIYQGSPPRKQSAAVNKLQKDLRMTSGVASGEARLPSRRRHNNGNRSRSRNRVWKKLLWVKQSCEIYFPSYLAVLLTRTTRSG